MRLYYLHKDIESGDDLQLFLTEEELKKAQIELMEEARGSDVYEPDYDDEEEFFDAWSDFCDNGTINQDYYFAGEVTINGVVPANQPELKV